MLYLQLLRKGCIKYYYHYYFHNNNPYDKNETEIPILKMISIL